MSSVQDRMKCIVFRLGGEEFGVDVSQVRSIERLQEVVHIPRVSSFVKGVINLRGTVTPVVDLRERLGFAVLNDTAETRLIVIQVAGQDVAFIVDAAHDVTDIERDSIDPTPTAFDNIRAVHLNGVAKLKDRLLVLLNLERVLADEEVQQVHEIAEA